MLRVDSSTAAAGPASRSRTNAKRQAKGPRAEPIQATLPARFRRAKGFRIAKIGHGPEPPREARGRASWPDGLSEVDAALDFDVMRRLVGGVMVPVGEEDAVETAERAPLAELLLQLDVELPAGQAGGRGRDP